MNCWTLDVEIHQGCSEEQWSKFLVHGHDDVLRTDDPEEVLAYLREELSNPEVVGG